MNYANYIPKSCLDGEGWRCVLFLSGCSHGCDGCFSPKTHNPSYGREVDKSLIDRILNDLGQPYIKGLTLSGGDPFHKRNIEGVIRLCKMIKHITPTKDIWVYTGYTLEHLLNDSLRAPLLSEIDVLVDGKYDKTLKPTKYVGSSNQRIIYLNKNH